MVRQHISWRKRLWKIKKTFVLILTPLVFLPLPMLIQTKAMKCAYGILIMAVYWVTEVIPMAVTGLLPIVIFPWLSVMDTRMVCENYLKDANMLFLGGLMVAAAVERWNLHKRIALRVLMLVGTKPRWLMFGFMATTAFLSMWISNTATAAMMVPISQAVLDQIGSNSRRKATVSYRNQAFVPDHEKSLRRNQNNSLSTDPEFKVVQMKSIDENITENSKCAYCPGNTSHARIDTFSKMEESTSVVNNTTEENYSEIDEWFDQVGKGIRLCIAYAANIGGTATLTGTGPNLVLMGQLDVLYGSDTGVNFSSWFIYAFPNMIISLFLSWLLLMILFIGPRDTSNIGQNSNGQGSVNFAGDVIAKEYEKLGPMSFAEIQVLIVLIALALLWLTRYPSFVPGWGALLTPNGWVTDSCLAITMAVLLFMLPSRWPNYLRFSIESEEEMTPSPPILDWSTINNQIPWNVVLLLGGGFAMAEASKESGLSLVIGKLFTALGKLPSWGLVFVLSILTALFTEVTSNVATATIFLPILAEMGTTLHINPLYLMLPVTISASFAFMLPVATPPNAIVFAYGNMKTLDMMKAGIFQNGVCLLILQVATNTWGYTYFNLGTFPPWACKKCWDDNNGTQILYRNTDTSIVQTTTQPLL